MNDEIRHFENNERLILSLFEKKPLDRNLLLLAGVGAGLSFWVNDFIMKHHMFHNALIRIIDKDKSLQKLTELLGGEYVDSSSLIPADLSGNDLIAFDLSGDPHGESESLPSAKLEVVDTIARELQSDSDRKIIIVFCDLLDFVGGGGTNLADVVTGIYRDAPSHNGAVLTILRSLDEIDYLGELGDTITKLFGACIVLRRSPEDLENLRRRGFFLFPENLMGGQ